jgi:hypothetical protein
VVRICASAGTAIAAAITAGFIVETFDCSKNDNCPDDDSCDIILDKAQLKKAGIYGREHQVKEDERGTSKNGSKFDLCGCKDGRVVLKAHGCKGPVISETDYKWK